MKRGNPTIGAVKAVSMIKLTKIDIKENRQRQDCKHSGISARKWYLVISNGQPYLGKFTKEWYGWNFDGIYDAGEQLDYLDAVYETDLNSKHSDLKRLHAAD